MRTLIYGAGTLGCLYAHRLFTAGSDVTILARGEQHAFIKENGVVLVNEFTGEQESSQVPVVEVVQTIFCAIEILVIQVLLMMLSCFLELLQV